MKKNYFTPLLSIMTVEDTIRTSAVKFGYTEQGAGRDLDWGSAITK